jgi:hypothetical protein
MPPSGTPRVDFRDFDEFHQLADLLITRYETLVEDAARQRITGWLSWPNYVNVGIRHEGWKLFLFVTKRRCSLWCWRMACIVEISLREVMLGLLEYHDYEILQIDPARCRRVLSHRVAPLLEDLLRGFFMENMVLVPFIPSGMRMHHTLSWPQVRAIRLALAMGAHPRLGADSLLFTLDPALIERIAWQLFLRPVLTGDRRALIE